MTLTSSQAIEALDKISKSDYGEVDKVQVRKAVDKLVSRLETPWESLVYIGWSMPALLACLKTFVDGGLFEQWDKMGGGPMTPDTLAKATNTDPILIARLLRHMGAMHAVEEVSTDTYALTPLTRGVATSNMAKIVGNATEMNALGFMSLPQFLTNNKYQNPHNIDDSNWQLASNSQDNFFQWLEKHPKQAADFHGTMEFYSNSKTASLDILSPDHLLDGWKKDRPLLVDVGGGSGHDIEKSRVRLPDLPAGSLVLEDLDTAIGAAKVHHTVETKVHDFFTPQPVKGARAYYMHTVLHDWPDDKASEILKNIATAMEPGYSRVLIHDSVITTDKPDPLVTTSDITMMMALSAFERTEAMWADLLASAGLMVVKIWTQPNVREAVIEAVLS